MKLVQVESDIGVSVSTSNMSAVCVWVSTKAIWFHVEMTGQVELTCSYTSEEAILLNYL